MTGGLPLPGKAGIIQGNQNPACKQNQEGEDKAKDVLFSLLQDPVSCSFLFPCALRALSLPVSGLLFLCFCVLPCCCLNKGLDQGGEKKRSEKAGEEPERLVPLHAVVVLRVCIEKVPEVLQDPGLRLLRIGLKKAPRIPPKDGIDEDADKAHCKVGEIDPLQALLYSLQEGPLPVHHIARENTKEHNAGGHQVVRGSALSKDMRCHNHEDRKAAAGVDRCDPWCARCVIVLFCLSSVHRFSALPLQCAPCMPRQAPRWPPPRRRGSRSRCRRGGQEGTRFRRAPPGSLQGAL